MRRGVIAVLLVALGCGEGTGTDVRTRSGPTQFSARYAVFFQYDAWASGIAATLDPDGGINSVPSGMVPVTLMDLHIQDAPWQCFEPDGGAPPADVARLTWSIALEKPATIIAGEHRLEAPAPHAESCSGYYVDARPTCIAQLSGLTDGVLSLASLDASTAQGSIAVSLEDGTRIGGEFLARRCPFVLPPIPDGGVTLPTPLPACSASDQR